jgi:hypothetical protein
MIRSTVVGIIKERRAPFTLDETPTVGIDEQGSGNRS